MAEQWLRSEAGRPYQEEVTDDLGKFWVVTRPTKYSELGDTYFETDVLGMIRQYKGGLKEEDILMITKDEGVAREAAQYLLDALKNYGTRSEGDE